MKRQTVLLGLSLSSLLLCGYIAPQDRRYLDYFLKKYSAELFRDKNMVLVCSSYYVGRNNIEKVDMTFSFCRPIPKNLGRQMIVDMSEALVKAINNDPELKKRGLLSRPFTVDRLVLQIRTDNIWSANVDVESCQSVTLECNTITYETSRWSTILSAGRDCSTEDYLYARMLCGKPTEYSAEVVCDCAYYVPPPVSEVVEKAQEPTKESVHEVPQTVFVGAFDAFKSSPSPYSSVLGNIEWLTLAPVEVAPPKKQGVVEEAGDNFNLLFPATDAKKTLRGRIKAGEQTIWKEAAPGAFTYLANESKKELIAVLDESQLDAISLALAGAQKGYMSLEESSAFNDGDNALEIKTTCSISRSDIPKGSFEETKQAPEFKVLTGTSFPVEKSRNEAYKDLVVYSYLPTPTENSSKSETQIDDSKNTFHSEAVGSSKAFGEVESSLQGFETDHVKIHSELVYQSLPQSATPVRGLVAIDDESSLSDFVIANARTHSNLIQQDLPAEVSVTNGRVAIEGQSSLENAQKSTQKTQSALAYQDLPQDIPVVNGKVAIRSESSLGNTQKSTHKSQSVLAYQDLPQDVPVSNGKVAIEGQSCLGATQKNVHKSQVALASQALPKDTSVASGKIAIESQSSLEAAQKNVHKSQAALASQALPKDTSVASGKVAIESQSSLEAVQKNAHKNQATLAYQSLPIDASVANGQVAIGNSSSLQSVDKGVQKNKSDLVYQSFPLDTSGRHVQVAIDSNSEGVSQQPQSKGALPRALIASADLNPEVVSSEEVSDDSQSKSSENQQPIPTFEEPLPNIQPGGPMQKSAEKSAQAVRTFAVVSGYQLHDKAGAIQSVTKSQIAVAETSPDVDLDEAQKHVNGEKSSFLEKLKGFFSGSKVSKKSQELVPAPTTQEAEIPQDQAEENSSDLVANVEPQEMPMDLPILPSDATEEVPSGMMQLDPEEENTLEDEFSSQPVESDMTTPESYLGGKGSETINEELEGQSDASLSSKKDTEVSLSLGARLLSWLGSSKDETNTNQVETDQVETDQVQLETVPATSEPNSIVVEEELVEASPESAQIQSEHISTEPEEVQETINF